MEKIVLTGSARYGQGIYAFTTTADGKTIHVRADDVEVSPNGDLLFWGGYRAKVGEKPSKRDLVVAVPAGRWGFFYKCSKSGVSRAIATNIGIKR